MTTTTPETATVPMEVNYPPAWLTWVASTTGCLNALGVNCSLTDVAGHSGYAFQMTVHETLCPSGPTVFDWGSLLLGINSLGRSTLCYSTGDCHTGDYICDRTREHCRFAFELVSREIAEGRPCVIWGAYVPEFSIAVGVENGSYIVKGFRECLKMDQPPVKYDEIDAPGGPYALAFPTETLREKPAGYDQWSLGKGVSTLKAPSSFPKYATGLDAYQVWIDSLKADKAIGFGNAYNAQCWAEARMFLKDFIFGLADKHEKPADSLKKAGEHYERTASAMKRLAELFPFDQKFEQIKSEDNRMKGIELLEEARKGEIPALDALEDALSVEW